MWYRYSQNQEFPEEPLIPNEVPDPPELNIPEIQEPPKLEPQKPQMKFPLPPLHENCHCYIETKPGGRQIWQFGDNCCEKCEALAIEFNRHQFERFGI